MDRQEAVIDAQHRLIEDMHRAVRQEDHLLEMEDAGERFIHARMMAIRDAMRDLPQFIDL